VLRVYGAPNSEFAASFRPMEGLMELIIAVKVAPRVTSSRLCSPTGANGGVVMCAKRYEQESHNLVLVM